MFPLIGPTTTMRGVFELIEEITGLASTAQARLLRMMENREAAARENDLLDASWTAPRLDGPCSVDTSRARAKLGWTPRRSLRTTLDVMLDRLKQDPGRWYSVNRLPMRARQTKGVVC